MRERWGRDLPDEATERIAYELKVIDDMGFSSYFLIVWDLIRHARERDIRTGPGRRSAAGCAVAHCLQITDIDPLRYELIFERFLNPSRVSMPDIDMDFDSRYRDEMIRYAAERYGRDHVAQVVTFSTIKARAAVRDAARVLGYPYALGDRVAKAMPPLVMGRDTPLWAAVADSAPEKYTDGWKAASELRTMVDEDPDVARVVSVARGLEGLRRQDGIHAAAVVITKDALTEYLPVQRKPGPNEDPEDAPLVTQYEMHGVEDLGLLKMDFLGLRNLDVITDTVELIRTTRGIDFDIDHVPIDDGPTYELLRRGDTVGVFQLEGAQMRSLMRSLAPTEFDDVAALVALYRPGPMAANMHNDYADRKNGRKQIEYLHPDAAEVLADTYGLMIYQEKLMRVAQTFAGYSLAEADNLRRACGKKIRELMAIEREKFVAGCVATGYEAEIGEQWFDIIEPFADYAFPKAHAYGYGYIAYQTAYLKTNFPVEYFAALLTSVRKNLDQVGVYLAECRAMGLRVTVPDVNVSQSAFTPVNSPEGESSIAFGLAAIRNAGESLAEMIVNEREANGRFLDFYDFCERVPLLALNKRSIEALIKAGAFDSLGHPRAGLLGVFEPIINEITEVRKRRDMGMMTLFEMAEGDGGEAFTRHIEIPPTEFDKKELLAAEKEMLGLYVSDHPLLGMEAVLRSKAGAQLCDLAAKPDGETVTWAGVITGVNRKWTKKGELMAVFTLEDLSGSAEVMVFPRTMADYGHMVNDDAIALVKARVDRRDDQPKLIALDISIIDLPAGAHEPLRLELPIHRMSESFVDSLRETLVEHPGAPRSGCSTSVRTRCSGCRRRSTSTSPGASSASCGRSSGPRGSSAPRSRPDDRDRLPEVRAPDRRRRPVLRAVHGVPDRAAGDLLRRGARRGHRGGLRAEDERRAEPGGAEGLNAVGLPIRGRPPLEVGAGAGLAGDRQANRRSPRRDRPGGSGGASARVGPGRPSAARTGSPGCRGRALRATRRAVPARCGAPSSSGSSSPKAIAIRSSSAARSGESVSASSRTEVS